MAACLSELTALVWVLLLLPGWLSCNQTASLHVLVLLRALAPALLQPCKSCAAHVMACVAARFRSGSSTGSWCCAADPPLQLSLLQAEQQPLAQAHPPPHCCWPAPPRQQQQPGHAPPAAVAALAGSLAAAQLAGCLQLPARVAPPPLLLLLLLLLGGL
jgi:hypothetical protein